jgi:hypothetical protein
MMFIELTEELAPIVIGLDVALLISGAAILASVVSHAWSSSTWRLSRPRLAVFHRAAVAR